MAVTQSGDPMQYELVQSALAARAGACWDRLEDAVEELISLHAVDPTEITALVWQLVAAAEDG